MWNVQPAPLSDLRVYACLLEVTNDRDRYPDALRDEDRSNRKH